VKESASGILVGRVPFKDGDSPASSLLVYELLAGPCTCLHTECTLEESPQRVSYVTTLFCGEYLSTLEVIKTAKSRQND
jgi:hypothetical protein